MRRVIIESPLAGDVERNIEYAKACMLDSLRRGESPFASHLLYAQMGILDDTAPGERTLGISAGMAWACVAEATAVYQDLGISVGMRYGILNAQMNNRPIEFRTIL